MRDRKVLNEIVHPLVRLAMAREIVYYHVLGHWAVVLDIPLLFESGLDIFCSVVLMVAVSDAEVQMKRLRQRDKGLSEQEARDRVGSQMGVEEKVERTRARDEKRGKVVMNDWGKEELERNVRRVIGEVRDDREGRAWRWWLWQSPLGAAGWGAWEAYRSWRTKRRWLDERAREKAML